MGDAYQDAAAKEADADPSHRADPIIVDGVFDEEPDGEDQHADTDLADEIFSDEFFQVGMFFEKAWRGCACSTLLRRGGLTWAAGRCGERMGLCDLPAGMIG
jgi:hypothetical protein